MNLKPTEPPKELMAGHRRCTQTQCSFFRSGHCQTCEKGKGCSARPYEINELCSACLSCENRPGYLRFGNEEMQAEMEKAAAQYDKPQGIMLVYGNRASPEHIRQEEELLR